MKLVKAIPIDPEAYRDNNGLVRLTGRALRGRYLAHLRQHFRVVERDCRGWGDCNAIVQHTCGLDGYEPDCFEEFVPLYALAVVEYEPRA